ncbi:Calmodulin-binding transcription activator 2 [Bienertia sinuspersici]
MPPSGSLFLFDRKVLRYFRKDGHSWRKKKDGKTVKEAHERLKAGSIDVLHCYYAHGENNENFQRRSYWMLEEELSHIVLVHYREVKGYRANFNRFKETGEAITNAPEIQRIVCNSEADNFMNSGFQQNSCQLLSQNTDIRSLSNAQAQASDYEDAESGSYQTKSTIVSTLEFDEDSSSQKHKKELDLWKWEDAVEGQNVRVQTSSVVNSVYNGQSTSVCVIPKQENAFETHLLTNSFRESQESKDLVQGLKKWQVSGDVMHLGSACKLKDTFMPKSHDYLVTDSMCVDEHTVDAMDDPRKQPYVSACLEVQSDVESNLTWICKELGDMGPVMPSSGARWATGDKRSDCLNLSLQAEFDSHTLGPSISQEQLFRIIDFAPNWGYAGSETKVCSNHWKIFEDKTRCSKISVVMCVFGEMEVPAEIIADGVLRCYAPPHDVAKVHFYVTCSNRLACSEVREFEYRDKFTHESDAASLSNKIVALQIRFCKLLSLNSRCPQNTMHCNWEGSSDPHYEVTSLLKGIGNEWFQLLELTSKEEFSMDEMKDRLVEKFLKEKLCEWLLCMEAESGNVLRVLDENGQGVLHLAAALGYDWAVSPIVAAGVSINFRDVHGWTALHWAAYYGRNSWLLAESALSAHLECLTFMDKNKQDNAIEPHGMTSVLTASERMATPVSASGDNLDGLSLKDSLAALCNATQAAAQIHQVYRLHSFKRKQITYCGNDKNEIPDEYALSVNALKSYKQGQHDKPVHAAAIRIQNKFRSWKGRRDFVTLRQKIVKIQAHFRGHQARKHYKAFVWSVSIVEKVILRWRRKRSGLRGFKSESFTVKSQSEGMSSKEDDYDFLKQGRKQAEERLQNALSRVKSMVRYPEARDQYRRLLTTVGEIKDLKVCEAGMDVLVLTDGPNAAASMDDDLVDIDTLLNGGTVP